MSERPDALALRLADLLPFTMFDQDKRAEFTAACVPLIEAALRNAEYDGFKLAQTVLIEAQRRYYPIKQR